MTDSGAVAPAAGRVPLDGYSALLFDLDGVITRTAGLHAAAWQRLFDEFLDDYDRRTGRRTPRFDQPGDYLRYVDGRRRYDGVAAFLASRGVVLPDGTPQDDPAAATVCGLGNRKNRYFQQALDREGVEVYPDAVALVEAAPARGLRLAVVSASENCRAVLASAGLLDRFDVLITGVEARDRQLAGKPAPDTYLEAAGRLQIDPAAAVVLEDAVAGVQAGRAGRFGLVVGVDRRDEPRRLADAGADLVVADLRDLLGRR